MTKTHHVRVKYLCGGIQPIPMSWGKPLPDLGAAMRKARDIAQQNKRPVSIRVVESVSGKIKSIIAGEGTGIVTEKPGAV